MDGGRLPKVVVRQGGGSGMRHTWKADVNGNGRPVATKKDRRMSNQKHCWLISKGFYFSEGSAFAVYDRKTDAVRDIKEQGFRYNKEQDLFLNNKEHTWMRIDKKRKNNLSIL